MSCLLLVFHLLCLLSQHSLAGSSVFLKDKSFSVTCSISSLTSGDEVHGNTQSLRVVRESYSTIQERATIEVHLVDNKSASDVFFLDTKNQQETALLLNSKTLRCVSSDIGQIKSQLLLDLLPFQAFDIELPPHVVGLAKVLYFIEGRKDQFELTGTRVINNQNFTSYFLKYFSPITDEWLKVEAFYSGSWEGGFEVPSRVTLLSANTSILINYSSLDLINNHLSISEHKNSFSVISGEVLVDRFAFPNVEGCINILYPKASNIFKSKSDAKFSFEARFATKSLEARPLRGKAEFNHIVKVSYHGSLDALFYREQDKTGVFKQLLNFNRLRMYQALHKYNSDSSSQCIITKIPKPEINMELGDLIVGSDHFLYLGRSRVRGIPCRIYVARLKSLPYWLEQPIRFKTLDKISSIRFTDRGKGQASLHVNEEDLSPVRLVIYQEKTQHIIRFNNFVWDLDHSIEPSDQFTFENVCSQEDETRFEVEMAVAGELGELPKYSRFELEMAYLKSLQDHLSIPVGKVYQLKTKLQINLDTRDRLLATFRVSGKTNSLTEPIFLGFGYPNPSFSESLYQLPIRSFQLCLWLGATMGRYFGYNALQRHCVLDISKSEEVSYVNSSKPRSFIIDPASRMEIYQVDTFDDPALQLYLRDFQWDDERLRLRFKMEALRKTIDLFEKPYRIEFVKVTPVGSDSSETRRVSGEARRYQGFGFKDERPNKLVEPSRIEDKEVSSGQMSYEQCHLACVSNFRCQSFSVCLHNYATECIISPISFRGANMIPLLNVQTDHFSEKTRAIVHLNDSSQVELVRRSNCALYTKDYLDMFKKKRTTPGAWLSHRNLFPVDNIEKCAMHCVDRNLEILRKEIGLTAQVGRLINAEEGDVSMSQAQIQATMKQHRLNLNGFCYGFHFIDSSGVIGNSSSSVGLFCSIGSSDVGEPKVSFSDSEMKKMPIEIYEFRVDLFYESQSDVHLEGYELRPAERATYVQLKMGKPILDEESYKTLLKMVEDGNNQQEYSSGDEFECSRACFTQSLGPWPSCRSFDIITDLRTSLVQCKLNSLTLHQAYSRKPNLILSNSTRFLKARHYEPKLGMALDESLLDETLHLYMEPIRQSDLWTIDLFLMTSTVCLALVSSMIATCLALKIIARKRVDDELLNSEGE